LFRYDRGFATRFVAGADEAGRGCLAGPLVAAAVLFDYEKLTLTDLRSLSALNDSKQHSLEMRETLYPRVLRAATRVAITSRCVRGIDERGLHKTNLAALSDVLGRVGVEAACASPTGSRAPDRLRAAPVVGGDATSAAIAAASVIAKVTRDRFMLRMEQRYPGWEFAAHVGYSTPEHRAAIEKLGVSPLHRLSFQSMAYQQLAL
jgi:ribonuclease HII